MRPWLSFQSHEHAILNLNRLSQYTKPNIRIITGKSSVDKPIEFPMLSDQQECRTQILKATTDSDVDKLSLQSFIQFLSRRFQFFLFPYYQYNTSIPNLGSIVIRQMIEEAKSLADIDFKNENFRKVYFVYDPGFSLQLLHPNWMAVPEQIKNLFKNNDPLERDVFVGKDRHAILLSWLLNVPENHFNTLLIQTKFVLTENTTYKLFHLHERKLTRTPLIIEGDTGVGKTYLLHFYSLLLNTRILIDRALDIAPCLLEKTSLWLLTTILPLIGPTIFYKVAQTFSSEADGTTKCITADDDHSTSTDISLNDIYRYNSIVDGFNLKAVEVKDALQAFLYTADELQKLWECILRITEKEESNIQNDTDGVYYLRLPTKEDRQQQGDSSGPTREDFDINISRIIPDFGQSVQNELETFVTTENFLFPPGV
ncbi:unnamed protein product, partial [Didymodactylos carnosus]